MQFNFGTLINSILVAIIIFYVYFYPKIKAAKGHDRRKDTLFKNPNDRPGKAQECLKHMKKLTKLETEISNMKDGVSELKKNNRQDHEKIFDKIDKIKSNRR